jgi:hypothetical protein
MRSPISITLILIILSLGMAGAILESNSVQDYVAIYNQNIGGAPDILKGLVGSETVDITIVMNNGSTDVMGFETQNGEVVKTVNGGLPNPTITVNTTESTINNIKSSGDPIAEFEKARNYGQVDIEGHTIVTKAKLAAALSSTQVLRFFYNIFFGQ